MSAPHGKWDIRMDKIIAIWFAVDALIYLIGHHWWQAFMCSFVAFLAAQIAGLKQEANRLWLFRSLKPTEWRFRP